MLSRAPGLLLAVLAAVLVSTYGHLVVTYPPARKYPLDFLDTIRTQGPCGMKKGRGPVTTLKNGSSLSVSWHIAYPHHGGYFLQLLDQENNQVERWPAGDGFLSPTNPTSLNYTVTLPSQPCENCTLQVIRQAREWGANYRFWSCADVHVMPSVPMDQMCSGHGNYSNNMCRCQRTYMGDKCQYKDDCVDDSDCGSGQCIDIGATYYPKKQCFCPAGAFGKNCERTSTVSSAAVDETMYIKNQLKGDDVVLYHRILEDLGEIEIMIRAKTTSWVAVGFRPRSLPDNCQRFPAADSAPNSEPEAEPEGTGEPESTAESAAEPESTAESAAEPESTAESAAEPESTPESAAEVEPTAEGVPEPEAEAEALGRHPMDCTDIVVGRARGNLSKVADSYTRDRSTPLEDEVFGGSESLTAALGYQTDSGYTVLLFRRKLTATEETDHPIKNELTHVIWARGQPQGRYDHWPGSGLETATNTASIPDYYRDDELKYHGHHDQRGVASINFFETAASRTGDCQGRWPETCPSTGCPHSVKWSLDEASDSISFTMTAMMPQNRWLGIGFSADRVMPVSDVIIGWVRPDGSLHLSDRYLTGYSPPSQDSQNDVMDPSGRYENGVLTLNFRRKRQTGDMRDFSFSDTSCAYFFFAQGGTYDGSDGVTKHSQTPAISREKICVRSCDAAAASGSKLTLGELEIILIACGVGFVVIVLLVVGLCKLRESSRRGREQASRPIFEKDGKPGKTEYKNGGLQTHL